MRAGTGRRKGGGGVARGQAAAVVVVWRGRCSTDRWTAEETRWPVIQSMVNKFRERPLGGTRGRPPFPGEEEGNSPPVRPAREGRNRGEGLRGRGGAIGGTLRCLQHARVEPEDKRPSREADRWNILLSPSPFLPPPPSFSSSCSRLLTFMTLLQSVCDAQPSQ